MLFNHFSSHKHKLDNFSNCFSGKCINITISPTGNNRSVFLVTYSRFDKVLCKDKGDFSRLVAEGLSTALLNNGHAVKRETKIGGLIIVCALSLIESRSL